MAVEYGTKGPLTMSDDDTPKKKPEVKAKWVDALKSGDYKKGQGSLRAGSLVSETQQFCCLGVLCDLYHKETGKGEWRERTDMPNMRKFAFYTPDGSFDSNYAPQEVLAWAGIKPRLRGAGAMDRPLAVANDCNVSFDPIVAIIESEL
jgi:hypothetical protein